MFHFFELFHFPLDLGKGIFSTVGVKFIHVDCGVAADLNAVHQLVFSYPPPLLLAFKAD